MANECEQWTEGPQATKRKLNKMTDAINNSVDDIKKLKNFPAQLFDVCVDGIACQYAIPSMLIEVPEVGE